MHILFLTDNFPPEVNAPASRTFEHCREWVKSGHQVTVITCAPNFPFGKVYDGYENKSWQQEYMDGICVIRIKTYITPNQGVFKRSLDYMSYMITSFFASLFVRKVDVVIGTSPQFFTVCSAYMVGLVKRVPWVFELRDIWPESIKVIGAIRSASLISLLEGIELHLYHKASAIISVTHAFKRILIDRGVAGQKIFVITNGVDMDRFFPKTKDIELVEKYNLTGKFVAGYIGTHGMAHALETILDAAKILKNSLKADLFRFVFLGDGANKSKLVQRAYREGLDNVIFVDSVPKDEVVRYWSILDVSIVHLEKTDLFKTVIPSKLFECMAMAIPVLHGVAGESAEILERADAGLVFEPCNSLALAERLCQLANDSNLYRRIKLQGPLAAKKYDRRVLAGNMLDVLQRIAVNR